MEEERIYYLGYFIRWEFFWWLWQTGISVDGVEIENQWLFLLRKSTIEIIFKYEEKTANILERKDGEVIYWEDFISKEEDGEVE